MFWPLPLISRIRGRTPPISSIDLPRRLTHLPASSGRPPRSCRGSQPRGGNHDLHHHLLSAANHRHRRHKSTGISYLDTWMGNHTNCGIRRRGASEPIRPRADDIRHQVPPISSHSALTRNNTHFANVAAAYASSNFTQIHQLPSATYQMFSLRPTKTDTPETLLERVKGALNEIDNSDNNGNAVASSSIIPLVLDLSAFHPDGSPHSPSDAGGSLTKFVEAIRSYREEQGNSTASGGLSFRLVGVANIPHHDTSMADEARSMKLPVFCIGSDGTSKSSNNPASSKREKRGGVAPLLRQRRPGVAATNKLVNDDSSTLTTRDDASPENSSGIHIVGMGALAPHDQACNSTKVHRGSIRSGQLLTSDR